MSTESFGSNDVLPPQPPSESAASAGVPGYPPAGQQERLATIRAQEAAAQPGNADAQLEGELASLDAGAESPTQRKTRLGQFIDDYFSEIVGPNVKTLVIKRCILFEDGCRELFEEPELKLGEEDATDPELKASIEDEVVRKSTEVVANNEAIAMKEGEQTDLRSTETGQQTEISDQETRISDLNRETDLEAAGLAQDEETRADEFRQEAEINRDLQTVKELQTNFENLKADHGTIGALKMLLGEDGVKSPEMRAIVGNAIATAEALVGAIPGKEEAIERLLDQSGLNLGAASQAEVFASLFTAAEASDEFTDEEVESLRAVAAGSDKAIRTGTDYENAMNATVLNDEGKEVPAYPEDDPLSFGVGLDGFTSDDGKTQYMRATPNHGQAITINVTNFSANEKAVAASYLDAWKMAEDAGQTDFLLNLTQYDIRGQSIIDPIQLIEAAQVVNALYGGRAGYNGEVLRGDDRIGMTRWQAQLATPKGDAARSDRNTDMSLSAMRGLGIQDQSGKINLEVLRAFGDYSRDNWFSAPEYEDVQAHLANLFPEKFADQPVRLDNDNFPRAT